MSQSLLEVGDGSVNIIFNRVAKTIKKKNSLKLIINITES